ncbi:MAG: hypothetical protein KDB14_10135 [Planctomycetales bacterium]|nr:hypothetical protein [Planctomycetales bacterium]
MSWGTFTYVQHPEVERRITGLCEEVRANVCELVPEQHRRALLLIGGYGRGEGGVEQTRGGPRPHNNLDFLLLTQQLPAADIARLAAQIDVALEPLRTRYEIGIDFSALPAGKLQRSPCLVMWYDMRYGHKTLAGDAEFLPSLAQFQEDRIPAWNVRDLLVNRGTLMVLNEWLQRLDPEVPIDGQGSRRAFRHAVRHLTKAIIGYGDALLYFANAYHWSYVEKLARMQTCRLADPEFAELYTEAMLFRFAPDYGSLMGRDMLKWQRRILPMLSHVHLCCESLRLRRTLPDWSAYPKAAAIGVLREQWESPRAWAKKLAHTLRDASVSMPHIGLAHWGLRAAGPRGRLSLAFPVVAYQLSHLQGWARELLGNTRSEDSTEGDGELDLLDAYVRRWGEIGDTNFRNFANRLESRQDSLRRTGPIPGKGVDPHAPPARSNEGNFRHALSDFPNASSHNVPLEGRFIDRDDRKSHSAETPLSISEFGADSSAGDFATEVPS